MPKTAGTETDMKKTLSVLAALLLAAAMLLTMAACGSTGGGEEESKKEKTPEELIVGKWETSKDFGAFLGDTLASGFGEESSEYFKDLKLDLPFTFEFDEDGTAALTIDEKRFEKSLDEMKGQLKKGLEQMLRDMAEANDADLNDLVTQNGYDTLDDFLDEALSELSIDEVMSSFDDTEISGKYELDGNKLFVISEGEERDDEDYLIFELDEDELKIDMTDEQREDLSDDEAALFDEMFPMEFTRK